jgi:hypothetical protein
VEGKNYKILTQEAFEIESDPIERSLWLKTESRIRTQVQEEFIMDEEGDDDE